MTSSTRGLPAFFVLLMLLIAAPAAAQVSTQPPATGGPAGPSEPREDEKDTGDWDVIVYPYVWVPNINLQADVDGVGASATITSDEVLKLLNFGIMGDVEVWYKRRWFVGVDGFFSLLYAKTESGPVVTSLGPASVTAGPLVLTVPSLTAVVGPVQARVDMTQLITLGYFGYRLHSGPVPGWLGGAGARDQKRLDVDAYVGGRLWYNKVTIDANGPPIVFPATTGTVTLRGRPSVDLGTITIPAAATGPIDVHVEKTIWWIDPVIGGRVRMDLSDRFFVRLTGDVGGLDWGSASKFTWHAWAMLGRRVKENWTIEAGYRGLGIIREKSAAEADLIYQGPVFGATYRF